MTINYCLHNNEQQEGNEYYDGTLNTCTIIELPVTVNGFGTQVGINKNNDN